MLPAWGKHSQTYCLLITCLENLRSQLFALGVAVDRLDQARLNALLLKVLEIAKSDQNTN